MKLDFSMDKAGDKYIGTIETPRPGVYDADVWEIVKRGRVFLIGTATNTGLLSEYYFKMEQGESEQKALEEINADLEVLATDGPSYMSRVTKIPRKISANKSRKVRMRIRRVRRNSSGKYGVMLTDIQLSGTGLNLKKGEKVRYESATNIPGGGVFVRPVKLRGIWKMVSPNDSIYIKSSEFAETILNWKDRKFLPLANKFGKNLRGNPNRQKAPRYSKTLPNKFYKIYWSHHARGDTAGLVFKGDKIIKISMSELSRFWPMNEGLKMERLHVLGPFDSWDQAFASQK